MKKNRDGPFGKALHFFLSKKSWFESCQGISFSFFLQVCRLAAKTFLNLDGLRIRWHKAEPLYVKYMRSPFELKVQLDMWQ